MCVRRSRSEARSNVSVPFFFPSFFISEICMKVVVFFCDDCLVLCMDIALYGVVDVLREFRRGWSTVIVFMSCCHRNRS